MPVPFARRRSRHGVAPHAHWSAYLFLQCAGCDNLVDQGVATGAADGIGIEATEVVPEDRISPEDRGSWTDSPLKQIVDFGGEGRYLACAYRP